MCTFAASPTMTSNFCLRGRELLLDLQRSDWLPAYDEEGVRNVLNEVLDLIPKIAEYGVKVRERTIENEEKPTLLYYGACLRRNTKYLHSYFTHRNKKIRALRWETGTVLPEKIRKETLSVNELDYFNEYNELITGYSEDIGVDLTSDLEPPRDLLVEIRVLEDCGKIMTEQGPVSLDRGSTHYLKRTDVEHLIRLGKVEMFKS